MKMATLIEQARLRAGLSLQDVADGTGISKAHVHDMEKGRSNNISLKTAVRLSICLSIPITVLAASSLEDIKNVE